MLILLHVSREAFFFIVGLYWLGWQHLPATIPWPLPCLVTMPAVYLAAFALTSLLALTPLAVAHRPHSGHAVLQGPPQLGGGTHPKLIYFNELDRGIHFAAWQEPALFSGELRAAFRSLR